MDSAPAAGYRSPTQIARRVTEEWGAANLYCPACDADRLSQTRTNTRAVDFVCHTCSASYQLKSSARWSDRVVDGAYEAIIRAIQSDSVPNLIVMHYSREWRVEDLLVVPSFFFNPSIIERRKALASNARRAGWVGCYILLGAVPPEGKLRLVTNGVAADPSDVRRSYAQIRPLSELGVETRGWAVDLLRELRGIGKSRFDIDDVYSLEPVLAARHPRNRHVRAKMRQQLQVLRDTGILRFLGQGSYEFV